MTKKSRQKFKYLENEKSFCGEIKSILKWLSMKQLTKIFWEDERPTLSCEQIWKIMKLHFRANLHFRSKCSLLNIAGFFYLLLDTSFRVGFLCILMLHTLIVLDYRWSQNPPSYQRTVTPNWYLAHTVP